MMPFARSHPPRILVMALLAIPIAQMPSVPEPDFSPLPTAADAPVVLPTDAVDGFNDDGSLTLEATVDETTTAGRSRVALTLPALINYAVTGNRDLRDRQLQRLIEQQELQQAEAQFDPRFTPLVGVSATQRWTEGLGSRGLSDGLGRSTTPIGDRTTLTQTARVAGTVITRQGTSIDLTLDALSDPPIGLQFSQPLLRGAGTALNEAPVALARLRESQNFFQLQQTLIDIVSTTVTQYTSLIQAQEAVTIQAEALARRRRQLVILTALVAAGREAAIDLADSRRSVANAERDLLLAQTRLEAANTALLDQIGIDQNVLFVASTATITDLFQAAVARIDPYEVETLLAIAYQRRPDFLQVQLDQDVAQLNRNVAADNLRWQLNIEGNANLGDFSETTMGIVAQRTFDDPALETARVRSEVAILQRANRLIQLQIGIRNEITNQLNTVRANLVRVEAARRATANARLQLEATRELFQRGRAGGNLFQVIAQEENLVEAQNQRLQAEIEFLNSLVALDRAVGFTLETWSRDVDFLPALIVPGSVNEFTSQTVTVEVDE